MQSLTKGQDTSSVYFSEFGKIILNWCSLIIICLLMMCCKKEPVDPKPKVELLVGLLIADNSIDAETNCVEAEVFFKNISNNTIAIPYNILTYAKIGITSDDGTKHPILRPHDIHHEKMPIMLLASKDTYQKRICLNEYYPVAQIVEIEKREFPTIFELANGKYLASVIFQYPKTVILESMSSQMSCYGWDPGVSNMILSYIADIEIIIAPPAMFEITFPHDTIEESEKEKSESRSNSVQ